MKMPLKMGVELQMTIAYLPFSKRRGYFSTNQGQSAMARDRGVPIEKLLGALDTEGGLTPLGGGERYGPNPSTNLATPVRNQLTEC